MENSILSLMIYHHALLETLFTVFRDRLKEGSPKTEEALFEFT